MRVNVELDYVILVCFSFDCRVFIVWLVNGDIFCVFKMVKWEDGGYIFIVILEDFFKKYKVFVIDVGIVNIGKFIMIVFSDIIVFIWSLKG